MLTKWRSLVLACLMRSRAPGLPAIRLKAGHHQIFAIDLDPLSPVLTSSMGFLHYLEGAPDDLDCERDGYTCQEVAARMESGTLPVCIGN